jgi:hypothetical protein
MARTLYDTQADYDNANDFDLFGDFAFRDLAVSFTSGESPLAFTAATKTVLKTTLPAESSQLFEWTGFSSAGQVEILAALDEMTSLASGTFECKFLYGQGSRFYMRLTMPKSTPI